MGNETVCTLRVGKDLYSGKARMDADHIDFVGPTKFRFRLAEIREPSYSSGALRFDFHGNKIALSVGDRTVRWYDAVVNPKSPADKIGVRAGSKVRLVNVDDEAIVRSLTEAGARVIHEREDGCAAILLGVERAADLRHLERLAESLEPDGAVWIVIAKTSRAITQGNVVAAARQAGLHDVKAHSLTDAFMAYRLGRPASKRNGKAGTARRRDRAS